MEKDIGKISYINIQGGMIYNLGLSGNELLLYALIHGYTQDGKNEYHGSLTYIQNGLLLSRPTVISLLQKLQEKGFIVQTKESHYIVSKESLLLVKKLYHPSKETLPLASKETLPNIYNTNNNTNNYSLSSNEDNSLANELNKTSTTNNTLLDNEGLVNVNNKEGQVKSNVLVNVKELANEKKIKKEKSTGLEGIDIEQQFEGFWKLYPRNEGKKTAKDSFKKKIKTYNDLMLLAFGLKKWLEEEKKKGTEPKFYPHCTTWLNQERFRDYEDKYYNQTKQIETKPITLEDKDNVDWL